MALNDLSAEYQHSALLIKNRLVALRRELKATTDPEVAWGLKRRIAELTPMLTEMNELAELTAHYYEKGHYRNEKYSANCFDEIRHRLPSAESTVAMYEQSQPDGSPAGYTVNKPAAPKPVKKAKSPKPKKSLLNAILHGDK